MRGLRQSQRRTEVADVRQHRGAAEARAVQALAEQLYRERYHYLLRIAVKHAANREDADEASSTGLPPAREVRSRLRGLPALAWVTLTLKRACWAKRAVRPSRPPRRPGGRAGLGRPAALARSRSPHGDSRPGGDERTRRSSWSRTRETRSRGLKPAERRALGLIAAGFSYGEVGEITGWTYTKTNRCAAEGRAGCDLEGQAAGKATGWGEGNKKEELLGLAIARPLPLCGGCDGKRPGPVRSCARLYEGPGKSWRPLAGRAPGRGFG